MLEFPTILNKGTIENIPLLLEIDHLTSEEDEAKPEEGGEHALLNIHGGVETMAFTTMVVLTMPDPKIPGVEL